MKVTIIIILSLLALSTAYYLTQQNEEEKSTHESIRVERKNSPQLNNNDATSDEVESSSKNEYLPTEEDRAISEELQKELSEKDIDPEYAENVSREDFQEFINAAIEELDSGEGMAIALTLEMRKIQIAQPNYRDIVKTFYEKCLYHETLTAKVKDICRKSLDELSN